MPNHFQNPWFFLLALPVLLALVLAWRRRPPSVQVASVEPFQRALGSRRRRPLPWALLLETVGALCLVVALARPQHGTETRQRRAQGVDIMLALDISGSMNAFDDPRITPTMTAAEFAVGRRRGEFRNRIEIARDELLHFIDLRPDDQLGVVAFAGYAYVASPPSLDSDFLKGRVGQLDTGIFDDNNTNLAAAITSGVSRLKDSHARRRVLVLFTDGMNSVDSAVTPRKASEIAREYNVVIHTVGIGSKDGKYVQIGPFGELRADRLDSEYDEQLMKDISSTTGGRFFKANDEAGLRKVLAEIDALEKVEFKQTLWIDYRELFPWWTAAGLAFLLLGWLIDQTLLLKTP